MVQLESSSATAETPAHEGYRLANTTILHHVTSKVQADSAVDLSNILQQQAATYPGLRARLGEAAARKIATKTVQPVTNNDRDPMAAQERLLQKASTEVICPLHSRLLAQIESKEVSLDSVSGQLSADIMEGLNQRIKNGQILWNLHNSFVLDIGSSVAVKICTHIDPDHITNLQFVNTHAPEVPTPKRLGHTLVSKGSTNSIGVIFDIRHSILFVSIGAFSDSEKTKLSVTAAAALSLTQVLPVRFCLP